MQIDIPQIDSCCDKEVYAFFGLAAYLAQVLERAAINLVLIIQLPEVNLVTSELYDSIYEILEKKTFGQLLRACEKEINITEDAKQIVFEALDLRNELTHRFFYERAETLMSEKGRIEIMKALQVVIEKLQKADEILESIYLPMFDKYGVTEEYLAREYETMVQKAIDRDNVA